MKAIQKRRREGSKKAKTGILNEFCKVCGRQRKHGPEVLAVVKVVWLVRDRLCSKRQEAGDASRRPLMFADLASTDGIMVLQGEAASGLAVAVFASNLPLADGDDGVGVAKGTWDSTNLYDNNDGSGVQTDDDSPILLKISGTSGDWEVGDSITLLFSNGSSVDVYLPGITFADGDEYVFWIASDGSTYYARHDHGVGATVTQDAWYAMGYDDSESTAQDLDNDSNADEDHQFAYSGGLAMSAFDAKYEALVGDVRETAQAELDGGTLLDENGDGVENDEDVEYLVAQVDISTAKSPAVDAGSDSAWGYDSTSTDTQEIDMGQPDVGYHYYRRQADNDPTANQHIYLSIEQPSNIGGAGDGFGYYLYKYEETGWAGVMTLGDTRDPAKKNISAGREEDFKKIRTEAAPTIDVGYSGPAEKTDFRDEQWYDLEVKSYYWVDVDGNGIIDAGTELTPSSPVELDLLIDRDSPVVNMGGTE